MIWKSINSEKAAEYNNKLKTTDASFFQYPYYGEGYRFMPLSKPVYLTCLNADSVIGFCTLMQIGFWPFKVGLVLRGPVFFDNTDNSLIRKALVSLANYAKRNHYCMIRINPNEFQYSDILNNINEFLKEDRFPLYSGSQTYNFNVKLMTADELRMKFKATARQKIKYAEEYPFVYNKITDPQEIKKVYTLFTEVGTSKKFSYRSLKSYEKIFSEGNKYGLCDVYTASINETLVCAAFIVKDKNYSVHFSSAMIVEQYPPKNSPAAKIHFSVMNDSFEKDNIKTYNISYSGPNSSVYEFKSLFNPELEEMPPYYTYVSNSFFAFIFKLVTKKNLKKWRGFLRNFFSKK